MKLRIVKDGNDRYIIQEKFGFFSRWETYDGYGSLEFAKEQAEARLKRIENHKKHKKLEKQLTLIEQYNLKDI